MLPVLRKGSEGEAVCRWQDFLLGQGFDPKGTDGIFGTATVRATKEFQAKFKLDVDGVVGDQCYGQAAKLGFAITEDDDEGESTVNFPPRPDFDPMTHAQRIAAFGSFDFVHKPEPGNFENIRILGGWESESIVTIEVPQLAGLSGAGQRGRARVHRKIQDQMLELWQAWDDAKLVKRVIHWDGAFVARFMRGRATPDNVGNAKALSNHSWGTAFDINASQNAFGVVPALVGMTGCVRELVGIANEQGFFWGGHFESKKDGMHFEVAKVK